MLFTGREVRIGKNCAPVPEVLSMAPGRRPRAILKTEGTVFPTTDRPRPVNNVFIFFLWETGLKTRFLYITASLNETMYHQQTAVRNLKF